jgi:hypothetical protein
MVGVGAGVITGASASEAAAKVKEWTPTMAAAKSKEEEENMVWRRGRTGKKAVGSALAGDGC